MPDPGRILIADNDEAFLNSTADLLHGAGYQCDCAPDGIAAAGMLQNGIYALLIAEIKMPGNSDLELIRALPEIAEGVSVILTTGTPEIGSAVESVQLPVAAYLVKPIDTDEFLEHVRTSIERSWIYRSVRGLRQRLHVWRKYLTNIQESLSIQSGNASSVTLDAFLDLTFKNVVGALSDLRQLTAALTGPETEREVCHLLECPRLATLTEALEDTIGVLEETKGAFKSRRLGELRRSLERRLNGKRK